MSAQAIVALQRSAGNRATRAMLQRVDFRRGVRIQLSTTNAATAMRWVEELENGDWQRASISHCMKLVRRIAHLAREVEEKDGTDAAKELWAYKKRAERVQRRVEIRESNTLPEKYSYAEIGDVMEKHAALTGGRATHESDEDS